MAQLSGRGGGLLICLPFKSPRPAGRQDPATAFPALLSTPAGRTKGDKSVGKCGEVASSACCARLQRRCRRRGRRGRRRQPHTACSPRPGDLHPPPTHTRRNWPAACSPQPGDLPPAHTPDLARSVLASTRGPPPPNTRRNWPAACSPQPGDLHSPTHARIGPQRARLNQLTPHPFNAGIGPQRARLNRGASPAIPSPSPPRPPYTYAHSIRPATDNRLLGGLPVVIREERTMVVWRCGGRGRGTVRCCTQGCCRSLLFGCGGEVQCVVTRGYVHRVCCTQGCFRCLCPFVSVSLLACPKNVSI
eukprot:359244-Chlamydomonas_euryale.AAC.1